MCFDPPAQPVLEYESPSDADPLPPLLVAMRMWRSRAGLCAIFTGVAMGALSEGASWWVAIVPLCGLGLTCVLTLIYMTRVAMVAVGVGYAVRQLLLALALSPVLLLGVFLVPRLIESDLMNWARNAEKSDA